MLGNQEQVLRAAREHLLDGIHCGRVADAERDEVIMLLLCLGAHSLPDGQLCGKRPCRGQRGEVSFDSLQRFLELWRGHASTDDADVRMRQPRNLAAEHERRLAIRCAVGIHPDRIAGLHRISPCQLLRAHGIDEDAVLAEGHDRGDGSHASYLWHAQPQSLVGAGERGLFDFAQAQHRIGQRLARRLHDDIFGAEQHLYAPRLLRRRRRRMQRKA